MKQQSVTNNSEEAADLDSAVIGTQDKAGSLAIGHVLEKVQSAKTSFTEKLINSFKSLLRQTEVSSNGEVAGDFRTSDIEAEKQAFIEKYSIQVITESQVALILPEGKSRIDFLEEAQKLAKELYGRDVVWPKRLTDWAEDEAFRLRIEEPLKLAVDCNVKASLNQTRSENESHGWNDVATKDVAIAHAAYFIATGKDLFDGNMIRTNDGILRFCFSGLVVCFYDRSPRYFNTLASRSLPFPE